MWITAAMVILSFRIVWMAALLILYHGASASPVGWPLELVLLIGLPVGAASGAIDRLVERKADAPFARQVALSLAAYVLAMPFSFALTLAFAG